MGALVSIHARGALGELLQAAFGIAGPAPAVRRAATGARPGRSGDAKLYAPHTVRLRAGMRLIRTVRIVVPEPVLLIRTVRIGRGRFQRLQWFAALQRAHRRPDLL